MYVPQEKTITPRTAYDLTGQDLVDGFGGAGAIRGDKDKQQKALQTAGLLGSLLEIKTAHKTGSESEINVAEEIFDVKMRDAVDSGLIPHPVDEDGELISDFEGPEAIAAAEKYLEQYLPKRSGDQKESRQEAQRDAARQDAKHTEKKQEKTAALQEDKKREMSAIVPPVDEKQDQQQRQEFMSQAKQAVMAESQRNIQYAANPSGGGGAGGEQEISGTLQLKGLTEVIMAASSKQMEQTNDGGPYVDTGNATKAYVGGAV
jgi:hypothetical protein